MELWDHEGTFDFAGSPPLVGTFKGALAIQTLYLNRVKTPGMKLYGDSLAKAQDVTLGVVDTKRLISGPMATGRLRAGAQRLALKRTRVSMSPAHICSHFRMVRLRVCGYRYRRNRIRVIWKTCGWLISQWQMLEDSRWQRGPLSKQGVTPSKLCRADHFGSKRS